MIRIGKNEDSRMKIAVGADASIWPVPVLVERGRTDAEIVDYYVKEKGMGVEVLANFNFTAEIIPDRWEASSESGSIIFKDGSDPFEYLMTQRNLLGLLEAIIKGYVEPTNRGLLGLFTFDRFGARLTINAVGGNSEVD